MPLKFTIEIKGLWAYRANYLYSLGRLLKGARLELKHEPSNPHDKNAIMVLLDGNKIGYLPKYLSEQIVVYLANKFNYEAYINNVSHKNYCGSTSLTATARLVIYDASTDDSYDELIDETKNLDNISGIYSIINKTNEFCYIGSSTDIGKRLRTHFKELISGSHANVDLSKSWNEDKPDSFSFELVEECQSNDFKEKERYYIELHESHKQGYNRTSDGIGRKPQVNSEPRIYNKPSKSSKPSNNQDLQNIELGCVTYIILTLLLTLILAFN